MTRLVLALVALAAPALATVGLGIVGRCGGPACAGEPVVCTARLQNKDTEGNRWVALDMHAVVHHADGTVETGANVLPAPIGLPAFNFAHTAPIDVPIALGDAGSQITVELVGMGTTQDIAEPTAFYISRVLVGVVDCGP